MWIVDSSWVKRSRGQEVRRSKWTGWSFCFRWCISECQKRTWMCSVSRALCPWCPGCSSSVVSDSSCRKSFVACSCVRPKVWQRLRDWRCWIRTHCPSIGWCCHGWEWAGDPEEIPKAEGDLYLCMVHAHVVVGWVYKTGCLCVRTWSTCGLYRVIIRQRWGE